MEHNFSSQNLGTRGNRPSIFDGLTWTISRSGHTFSLDIPFRGEIIPISLRCRKVGLIERIPSFQAYFDSVIMRSPRTLSLIDRILHYHSRFLSDEELTQRFHEMLWYLAVLMPNRLLEYTEVEKTLEAIQRLVFYGLETGGFDDFAIVEQSGTQTTKVISVKELGNQSGDLSCRQKQRLRREIEARERARLKALDEKMRVPHDVRKRKWQAERKAKRFVKNLFIEEQGGFKDVALFLPRTIGAVACIPLNLGRAAANLAKVTARAANVDVGAISEHLQNTLRHAQEATVKVGDAVVDAKNQLVEYLKQVLNSIKAMLTGHSDLVLKPSFSLSLSLSIARFPVRWLRQSSRFALDSLSADSLDSGCAQSFKKRNSDTQKPISLSKTVLRIQLPRFSLTASCCQRFWAFCSLVL